MALTTKTLRQVSFTITLIFTNPVSDNTNELYKVDDHFTCNIPNLFNKGYRIDSNKIYPNKKLHNLSNYVKNNYVKVYSLVSINIKLKTSNRNTASKIRTLLKKEYPTIFDSCFIKKIEKRIEQENKREIWVEAAKNILSESNSDNIMF